METEAGVSWGTTPAAAAGVPGVGVTAAPAGGAGVTGQAVVLGVVTVALLLAVAATAWTVKTRSRWAGNGLMVLLCAELGWGWVLAAVHGAPAERPAVWAWAGATLVLVVVAAGVAARPPRPAARTLTLTPRRPRPAARTLTPRRPRPAAVTPRARGRRGPAGTWMPSSSSGRRSSATG
ncbi:hypothetical protein MTQ16_00625 [Corynebacterium bovis]|uniref:hypothetical protein n=1 Tax=Corynebacterium bovis TaxID=36808 RepID=UPI003139179D